jgi:hypothetical protein
VARWIKAEDIPMHLRLPHLKRYQRQLRDALLNPALSQHDRDDIKERLARLGQPRVYTGNISPSVQSAPSPVSASTPVVEPAPVQTLDDLLVLLKDELLAIAAEEGLGTFKSKATKNDIAQAILDHREKP